MDAILTIGGRDYAISHDIRARRICVAEGPLVDDADGRGPGSDVAITVNDDQLRVEIGTDRYAVMTDPDVGVRDTGVAHLLTLGVTARGYQPQSVTITIPAGAPRPVQQSITLRRLPAPMRGRVLGRVAGPPIAFPPVANATLAINGPMGPGGALPQLLTQPLPTTPGPTASFRARFLTGEPACIASSPARPGDARIALTDITGVAAGQILSAGPDHNRWWAEIASTTPDPDRPAPAGWAWLTSPLTGSTTQGAVIGRFTKGALTGPVMTPVGPLYAGESLVLLDVISAAGDILVLREAGQPDFYFDRNIRTDPLGHVRALGLGRLPTCQCTVSAPGFTSQTRSFPLARLTDGPVDWRLVP